MQTKMTVETKDILDRQFPNCMSKCRIMKNLIITSLGFFFLFCAYQSLASLQTSINTQGSMSQSVIYASFAVSSLLFPKLIIRKLGCKITLVVSVLAYIPFMASNYCRSFLAQFFASALLGLGGATLWSSGSTYINEISILYSSYGMEPVDVVTTRFFGIFFMIFQSSQIWGNLASFHVLKPTFNETAGSDLLFFEGNESTSASQLSDNKTLMCGANFCHGISQHLSQFSESKRFILITVYLVLTILAAAVMALFLDPLQRSTSDDDDDESNLIFSKLTATLKHLRKPNQILLIPITVFLGLEQAFMFSDYSQGYIACAWGIYNVSLVFICFGVVSAVACFLTGRISKYVPRPFILLTGAMANILACSIMFLWRPDNKNVIYFFITMGLWGISDAVWQTEVNSLYGILFRKVEEAAFGNLRLWEAIGYFIPYFWNKHLCMSTKLYLVLSVLATGLMGCLIVEMKIMMRKRRQL